MTHDHVSQDESEKPHTERDDHLDEVEEESFPASDPQSSWAGTDPDSGQ